MIFPADCGRPGSNRLTNVSVRKTTLNIVSCILYLMYLVGRAYGNVGLAHESAGNFEKALEYQQQHLTISTRTNDRAAITLAYSSLGTYPGNLWACVSAYTVHIHAYVQFN